MTISRFFVLHVAIFPGILAVLIGLHLVAFRQCGISGPWDPIKRKRTGQFWPDQIFKDSVIVASMFILLVGLSAYFPPPFSGPKDAMITSYVPKPEWYFLFLYQTLKAFPGRLEPIGTVGIPLLVVLLLVFLPFYDRSPERNPWRRPTALVGYLLFISWVITLAVVGHYSNPAASAIRPSGGYGQSSEAAQGPADPPGNSSGDLDQGRQLFHSQGCIGCHRINGEGGTVGPALSSVTLQGRSRQWSPHRRRNPSLPLPERQNSQDLRDHRSRRLT
jgi:ubiquinol-cytochrome c reductase cytochrome b subunit